MVVLTKGNSNVLNIDSKRGSVGFTSVLLPSVYPVSIIRVDEQVLSSQFPFFAFNISYRRCLFEVPMAFVFPVCLESLESSLARSFRIIRQGLFKWWKRGRGCWDWVRRGFDGYVDKTATDSKIIRDVLRRGDTYFRFDLSVPHWKGLVSIKHCHCHCHCHCHRHGHCHLSRPAVV